MEPKDATTHLRKLEACWEALDSRFKESDTALENIFKFRNTKQEESLSANDFLTTLVGLASKAFPGSDATVRGQEIITTFIMNVRDELLERKLLPQIGTITYNELETLVKGQDQAESLSCSIRGEEIKSVAKPVSVKVEDSDVGAVYPDNEALQDRVRQLELNEGIPYRKNASLTERVEYLEAHGRRKRQGQAQGRCRK